MSCHHDSPVKFEFFMDRTPACYPQYTHDLSDEVTSECFIQMEHSYSRDHRPTDKTMATRTILVHKPPKCPSCHNSSHETEIDMGNDVIPQTNVAASREAMEHIGNIATKTKNRNLEEDDWEQLVDKIGWTVYQHSLFAKVAEILNLDRLARLTYANHPSEPTLRRASIDKAVQRTRKAFAAIHWDLKLTQWLHGLLIDHLPVSYATAYMDILQTLRYKVPSLVDKMVQGRSTELLEAVMKPPWEPSIETTDRKVTPEPVIVIMPSGLTSTDPKLSRWQGLLSTITPYIKIVQIPDNLSGEYQVTLPDYLERLVTLSRTKLHEIRKEYPLKPIILLGFNAGAALAVQVASVEQNINSVICMGFSTNTLKGSRGTLDDRLVDLQMPALFVIGHNSARTSQEQIEALREQMLGPTALVVVGSADDCLNVPHGKRRLENVTQAMVDNMIMNEVADFATNCITSPPSPVKKRPAPVSVNAGPATIVILDTQDKGKGINGGTSTATANVRKPRTPVKLGRVSKKKLLERNNGVVNKMSPPKKEYAEKLALTTPVGTTSYEIVTGKFTQDANMRQVVDKGFIQIASENATKWQVGNGRPTAGTTLMMPMIQKQKISLGNQFTPMRANGENYLIATKTSSTNTVLPRNAFSVNGNVRNTFTVQAPEVTETIDLDSDEEIINIEGERIVGGHVLDGTETMELDLSAGDISNIPVVFQDSEEVQADSATSSAMPAGSVVVTSQSVIPRPNKFIYYKPQQMVTKGAPTQYVVLSNMDEQVRSCSSGTPTGGAGPVVTSSKPLIISVESLEKGTPNTVYHVVDDSEKDE